MNITAVIAILIIAMLEVIALVNQVNGALLAGSIAIIAGLGGYTVGKKRPPK